MNRQISAGQVMDLRKQGGDRTVSRSDVKASQ